MKKTQKFTFFIGLFIVLCVCTNFKTVYSASDVIVSLQIDNPTMEINGACREIDLGRGTVPVVINGRTLVPIRAIIEAFGGTVGWDGASRTVTLTLDSDVIKLTIDSNDAYLNDKKETLDVSPAIVNGRTMLPIRFIAEGFNLGVAWEADTRTVTVISNTFTDEEYQTVMSMVPAYSGEPYIHINADKPFFKDYEIIEGSFEYYAELDNLGRCDVAMASVGTDLMPIENRESISSITPTGWINARYDVVSGGYLYNRCHLIGFQLTGENSNERNLITGTRYLNIDGMLPFENMIDDYVEKTGNNVVYRSTPVFTGDNLLADGVLLEAYSVEDNGSGISFCVYCYNVQPKVTIDYSTGHSFLEGETQKENHLPEISVKTGIYRTPTGKRYHFDPECGGKNSYEVTMEDALGAGLTPCRTCVE